jgi:galactokinase
VNQVAARLAVAGLTDAEIEAKTSLLKAAEHALGSQSEKRWFIPGRIEVFGKHTDYAGGPSLVCCAERGFCVVARQRHDSVIRVTDALSRENIELPLSTDIGLLSGWANYVATVVRRIARNFRGATRGVDIAFASDLPQSAGLSSSSALIIAIFAAIADANCLQERSEFAELASLPEKLAAYLACIENGQTYGPFEGDRGVGTFGGSEDHTAILCCRAGCLSQYEFAPVRLEQQVDMPEDWIFVVAHSGVTATKTGAARDRYNRISLAAKAVLDIWNERSGRADSTLAAALQHTSQAADEVRKILRSVRNKNFSEAELLRRFDHFALESQLVPAAARAFAERDAIALGEIAARSQSAAEELLGNQITETIALVREARKAGAIAASAFGAGFGGSVWALVPRTEAQRFMNHWRSGYMRLFPLVAPAAQFFTTAAGPAMTKIEVVAVTA